MKNFTAHHAYLLNQQYRGADTNDLLRGVMADKNLGRLALVSSFGAESAVLLDLAASVKRDIPVLMIDTLRLFPETLAYRDTLVAHLGLTDVRVIKPEPLALAAKDEKALRWSYDPDGCCAIRKVEPLRRALEGFDSWISGRKAFQTAVRRRMPIFEIEEGRIKINPLAEWTRDQLHAYLDTHALPRHPLEAMGYASIGCMPCTSPVQEGEDPRAGRWRGWDKTECGIHGDVDEADQPVF